MVLDGAITIFGVGCAGGVLTELLHWWALRESHQLPAYAKSLFYWIVTLVMILAGGLMAWLYFGERAEAIIVLHIGLSAPLILQKLATTMPEQQGAKNLIAEPKPSLRQFFRW